MFLCRQCAANYIIFWQQTTLYFGSKLHCILKKMLLSNRNKTGPFWKCWYFWGVWISIIHEAPWLASPFYVIFQRTPAVPCLESCPVWSGAQTSDYIFLCKKYVRLRLRKDWGTAGFGKSNILILKKCSTHVIGRSLLYMGHQQTVQNQIRHHTMWHLIRFCTVCFTECTLKIWLKLKLTATAKPANSKWIHAIVKGEKFHLAWKGFCSLRECSGSVVECLTGDRGAAG